jgi:hypothetical protein
MGIVHELVISKERLNKLNLTQENVIDILNKEMDLDLFVQYEDDDNIRFELNESVLKDQLSDFMQFQFSLYNEPDEKMIFESTLNAISEITALQEMVALAKEKEFQYFQYNRIYDEIKVSSWDWLKIEISMFVIFVEGKIIMEGYNQFLRYLENVIRSLGNRWSIAGAFRAFID